MRWRRSISVADVHAEGEPGRVVTGGVMPPPGDSILEQMLYMRDHDDWLRRFLLNEPRGAGIASANVIYPPKHPEADAGYVIMESVEYPPMSGSNTICTATALIELGILPMTEREQQFVLEAPAGLIRVRAQCQHGKVTSVTFQNVPAFAPYLDEVIEVPHLGNVRVDIAWGGMWFAIAQAAANRMIPAGRGGSIIQISSIAGISALGRGNWTHSVNKGGIHQLTKELAVEWARYGIRVNAILPCQVRTESFVAALEQGVLDPAIQQRMLDGIPMGRMATPEDIAGPAVFLASDAAAMVTGTLLPVDGGNLALNAGGSREW